MKLQSTSLDIINAFTQINDVTSYYKTIRNNISQEFQKIYQQAERMGAVINVEPSKPRSCSRQINRPNATAESVEGWYKINVAIPFVDHIISELTSQFSQLAKTASLSSAINYVQ